MLWFQLGQGDIIGDLIVQDKYLVSLDTIDRKSVV